MPSSLRFYFSFRSPYAWVAAHRLARRLGADLTKFQLIPFWEPDQKTRTLLAEAGGEFLYKPMSRERHLYILQDIKRIAAELNLVVRWPVDPPQRCWEMPHLAFIAARNLGAQDSFFWAVYRARWEEGRNICDPMTLGEIAKDLTLNVDAILNSIDDPVVRQQGADALVSAFGDLVFGVPFFVVGRNHYWGQDRLDVMLEDAECRKALNSVA